LANVKETPFTILYSAFFWESFKNKPGLGLHYAALSIGS